MRFDILTLFPELFSPFLTNGINRRAFESGQVQLHFWNPRDFADGQYRRVDDRPFGGGPGMVMMVEPLARCLQAALNARADDAARADADADADATSAPLDTSAAPAATAALVTPVVLFSPIGQRLDHGGVVQWAQGDGAVLVCGRYEGLDQRFIDTYVTHQISLGDFVLSGGEIAALALLDAVARLQPGVLGDAGSHQQDSFNPALDGLLDCPHYTRPEVWNGPQGPQGVPEVLLSGHHARIERHRREASLSVTAQARPDLLDAARAQGRLSRTDTAWLAEDGAGDGRRHGPRLAPDSPGKL